MAGQLFTGNVIAIIWDYDRTLIKGYQQNPLFSHFNTDSSKFWDEVNNLSAHYLKQGVIVSEDTIYLNHILTYVNNGLFKGLTNNLLKKFGEEQTYYRGIPEIFEETNKLIKDNNDFKEQEITLEHYIVSTGLRQVILGSKIKKYVEGVWACDFIGHVAKPDYNAKKLNDQKENGEISQVGYFLDNTTKTRAIWEINKGTNKFPDIGVNDRISPEDRRVPIPNMIYIADGPSDIPVFSIISQYGGKTLGVYDSENSEHYHEVKKLQDQGRVNHFTPAEYQKGSDAYKWIMESLNDIGNTIVKNRKRLLADKVKKSSKHVP